MIHGFGRRWCYGEYKIILVININLSTFKICKNGSSLINTRSEYIAYYILHFCKIITQGYPYNYELFDK